MSIFVAYYKKNAISSEAEKERFIAFIKKEKIRTDDLQELQRDDLIKIIEEYEKNNQQDAPAEQKTDNEIYNDIMQSFDDSFFQKNNNEIKKYLSEKAKSQ